MESGTQFEERSDRAVGGEATPVWAIDTSQAFEHRALARTVGADQTDGGTVLNFERNIVEGPELVVSCATTTQDRRLDVAISLVVEAEVLGDVLYDDCRVGHALATLSSHRRTMLVAQELEVSSQRCRKHFLVPIDDK